MKNKALAFELGILRSELGAVLDKLDDALERHADDIPDVFEDLVGSIELAREAERSLKKAIVQLNDLSSNEVPLKARKMWM